MARTHKTTKTNDITQTLSFTAPMRPIAKMIIVTKSCRFGSCRWPYSCWARRLADYRPSFTPPHMCPDFPWILATPRHALVAQVRSQRMAHQS